MRDRIFRKIHFNVTTEKTEQKKSIVAAINGVIQHILTAQDNENQVIMGC